MNANIKVDYTDFEYGDKKEVTEIISNFREVNTKYDGGLNTKLTNEQFKVFVHQANKVYFELFNEVYLGHLNIEDKENLCEALEKELYDEKTWKQLDEENSQLRYDNEQLEETNEQLNRIISGFN